MRVMVNGVRLFFEVIGTKLAPDGPRMRAKPTLVLLHGGPGFDHSSFRPRYESFSDQRSSNMQVRIVAVGAPINSS